MRYLQPTPWYLVKPGAVVLDEIGTPRTVIMNMPNSVRRTVALEGLSVLLTVRPDAMVQPVELDTADAIGNLFAAGLNPTPIEET